MTHAAEGLLQAYLDDEIDGPAAAGLLDHLAACAACAAELEALRLADRRAREAIALLPAADAPLVRARAAIAAQRGGGVQPARRSLARIGAGGLARAAILILALAGAAAAAIPGSPLRRALEHTFDRVAHFFNGVAPAGHDVAPAVPAPALVAPASSRMAVLPADGRVRVILHQPAGQVDVTVRLVDEPLAEVEVVAAADGVRFRTGAGRIEVSGVTGGTVAVAIPRGAVRATVEVDGRVHAYKHGDLLRLSGPAGRERGEQVRFRAGT